MVQAKCTKIAEEQCKPITREVCTTEDSKPASKCEEVEKQIPEEVCQMSNVTQCKPIMREVCDIEVRQRCESVTEEVPFEVRFESLILD